MVTSSSASLSSILRFSSRIISSFVLSAVPFSSMIFAATSSVFASAFSSSRSIMVLLATTSSVFSCFFNSWTAFSTSASVASSGSPNNATIFFSSILLPPSAPSGLLISILFTNANIPSIAGVLVNATLCKATAFPSLFRQITTGDRYLYSLFSRYCFAFAVHSTCAAIASFVLTIFLIQPPAGACISFNV